MNVMGQTRVWVTRHLEEEFHMDCIIPKFKRVSGCMMWGGISGRHGIGM